jgi:hypothetical protein
MPLRQRTRKINNESHAISASTKKETWESIYKSSDTNNKFNSFLYFFQNTYEASFPTKYKNRALAFHNIHK